MFLALDPLSTFPTQNRRRNERRKRKKAELKLIQEAPPAKPLGVANHQ